MAIADHQHNSSNSHTPVSGTPTKISADAHQSHGASKITALPNSLKVTTNFNFLIDENSHSVGKSAQSPPPLYYHQNHRHSPVQQPHPQPFLHQATTTTVTTKRKERIISVAPMQQVISNLNQLNINTNFNNQKNLRHSLSPSAISHNTDKQYFNPLNVNTQTHIYHHFYPTHSTYPLQ